MMMLNKIINQSQSTDFAKRLGWMLTGEGVIRVTRLVTAVVLARSLTPIEFCIAALILSIDEIIKVITRNGIGLKIIQFQEQQLKSVCQRAYQLNWFVHILLFTTQMLIAKPLAMAFSFDSLQALLSVLALTYLIYPLAMVQVNLLQRQQNMRLTSLFFAIQIGSDNLLTAMFALSGFGVWSIILPKLIVAPIWVICYRLTIAWRYNRSAPKCALAEIAQYAVEVFGVELLKALRQHADRVFIGFLLGLDALGIYYFAVNAGSGLSSALIKAFTTVALPDVCQQGRKGSITKLAVWLDQYQSLLKRYFIFVVPLIVLQLITATWYVPIIFGQQWVTAIPVLMVLCAAMIFQGIIDTGGQIFRASGHTRQDFKVNLMSTVTFFAAICAAYWLAPLTDMRLFLIAIATLLNTVIFAAIHCHMVRTTMSACYQPMRKPLLSTKYVGE